MREEIKVATDSVVHLAIAHEGLLPIPYMSRKHTHPSFIPHLLEPQDLPLLISSPAGHASTHICAKVPDKALWTNIQENIVFFNTVFFSIQLSTKWQFHKSANHWKDTCLWLKWLIHSQTGCNEIQCGKCTNLVWRENGCILSFFLPLSELEKGLILGQCGQCRFCEEFFILADSNLLSKITGIYDVSSEYWCCCPRSSVDILWRRK